MNPNIVIVPEAHQLILGVGSPSTITFSGVASFVNITNNSGETVQVELNGLSTAAVQLSSGDILNLKAEEIQITSLDFTLPSVISWTPASVQVIAGVYQ